MIKILIVVFFLLTFLIPEVFAQYEEKNIIFTITNASEDYDLNQFIINITDLNSNKELCKSNNCNLEVIKLSEFGLTTGSVSEPTLDIQSMHAGVDMGIRDSANNAMSETDRMLKERWSIWASCKGTTSISNDVFHCSTDGTFDTITLENEELNKELTFQLIEGSYDPKTDTMYFSSKK